MTDDTAAPRHRRLYDRPWLMLMLPPLFWAGNAVVGRAVAGAVPPVGLAFWRWCLGTLILLPLAWPHLKRDLPELRRRWRMMLLLTITGIAIFNTFLYIGLTTTTALNGVMIQATMPVLIVLANFLLFGERVSALQAVAIAVSLAGAVILIGRGNLAVLASFSFNRGDLWVAAAVVSYAVYTALVKRRPAIHPFSFLAATFAPGALMLLPVYLAESLGGNPVVLHATAIAAIGYVAVFPSILAYFCYNRAVQLVGPNRTGLSIYLVPMFGSLLAILFLGESLHLFHAVGMALIVLGIVLANRRR
jgi:drug/metabolite transporter (DMT)-like permease